MNNLYLKLNNLTLNILIINYFKNLLKMVKRCFVANCKTGCKSERKKEIRYSLFKAPNDKSLLEKWRELVPPRDRELTSKDCICEKHFEERYILPRFQQSRLGDYYEDHIRSKLVRDAIPTIFNDTDPKEKTSNPLKVLSDNMFPTNVFKLDLPNVEVNEDDTVPICYECLLGKCVIHIVRHS